MNDIINSIIVLFVVFSLTFCSKPEITEIPFRSKVDIEVDGVFGAEEWDGAQTFQVTPTNFVSLFQNENYLFLGIRNKEHVSRYVDLYIANDAIGTTNLHASMQLGERQLIDHWNDTTPAWNWGNNIDWEANIVEVENEDETISFLESVKPYEGHEFQISKRKLKGEQVKIRIEIKDFVGQASDVIFPAASERYNTEHWFVITLK